MLLSDCGVMTNTDNQLPYNSPRFRPRMIQEIDQTQDVESTPHLHVRVMSFNVRYATAEDGENHWETRRELAVQRIHAFQPDLLGVQECQDDEQVAYLKEHLPEYAMAGVRRGGSEHLMGKIVNHADQEMTAVFYREAAFELMEEVTVWWSKMRDCPPTSMTLKSDGEAS